MLNSMADISNNLHVLFLAILLCFYVKLSLDEFKKNVSAFWMALFPSLTIAVLCSILYEIVNVDKLLIIPFSLGVFIWIYVREKFRKGK